MKQPELAQAEGEGRIRLKDLLNEGMESSGVHISDIELENGDKIIATSQNSLVGTNYSENVAANDTGEKSLEALVEQAAAPEQVKELEAEPVKISPVKEWLNKEKEKAQAAEKSSDEVIEEAPEPDDEAVLELAEEIPAEIKAEVAEEPVSGYKIEGMVKVSGETGKLTIEKISEEEAARIKAVKIEVTPPQHVADEFNFPRNKGFQRPQDVLKEWVRFANLQLGTIDSIGLQLQQIARDYGSKTSDFNAKLNMVAEVSGKQGDELEIASGVVNVLHINDENVALSDSITLINKSIEDAAANANNISQKAAAMMGAMSDAQSSLSSAEVFIRRLNKITKQANMLAVNAGIEASRAGDAGAGFGVLSDELSDLAGDITKLSYEMHEKIGQVIASVGSSYATLNEFATIDVATNILDKDKIEAVIGSVLKQNEQVELLLRNNAAISKHNSETISQLVVQDNSAQQMEDIGRVLQVISGNISVQKAEAIKSIGVEIAKNDIEKNIIEKILAEINSEQVKKELVNFLVANGYVASDSNLN
jgi:methyl-accepting chemotaxis protein